VSRYTLPIICSGLHVEAERVKGLLGAAAAAAAAHVREQRSATVAAAIAGAKATTLSGGGSSSSGADTTAASLPPSTSAGAQHCTAPLTPAVVAALRKAVSKLAIVARPLRGLSSVSAADSRRAAAAHRIVMPAPAAAPHASNGNVDGECTADCTMLYYQAHAH
jgi:hypothetical protein